MLVTFCFLLLLSIIHSCLHTFLRNQCALYIIGTFIESTGMYDSLILYNVKSTVVYSTWYRTVQYIFIHSIFISYCNIHILYTQ